MADDGLIARQTLAHSWGLDKEVVEKRYGVLRPSPEWLGKDSDWLGKFADDAEEAMPALGGMWDAVLGAKPKQESHDPKWWGHERPKPHRGMSADPAIAEAKSRVEKELRAAAAEGAAALKKKQDEAKAEEEDAKNNEQMVKNSMFAESETQKRRLSFFGRPVQKCRLTKLKYEVERKAHEHQAALWAHLGSDAETEREENEKIEKEAIKKKNEAASAAAANRAEERGARVAAAGLKPMGAALKDAMKTAMAAEEKYRAEATKQETISRHQKDREEAAHEIIQQELEKERVCRAQIKAEKAAAKDVFERQAKVEEKEILALLLEEEILKTFKKTWEDKLGKVAKGSPAYSMVQGNIDEYDLKGDVVAMEKRMYVPTYLKTAPKKPPGSYSEEADTEGEKRVEDTFRLNPKSETKRLEYHPERKPLKWIEVKQMAKDGVIGLGKGAVGPELKHRVKIVQKKGEGEHPDIALDEVACDDVFANPIQLRMDYLESEHPQSKYLTRKDFDAGEKVSSTLLNAETFQKIWGHAGDMPWDKKERDNIPPSKRPKDEHKPWDCAHTLLKRTLHPPLKEATSVFGDPKYVPAERTFADAQAAKVKMRHKPDFIWCCMWVVDDEGRKEHKLHNSEVLGPSKGDYVQAMAPPFHPSDKPNDDPNDEPRRYGRICRWEQEPGTDIKPGDDLIAFRVYSNKLVHAKRNPNGRFPNTLIQTKEEKEKYAKMDVKEKELFDLKAKEIEEEMKMFDGEWIDDIEGNALSLMWDEVASGMDAAKKKTQIKEVTKNGTEIKNADLALALTKKLEFTKEELDKFKVKNEHLACDEDGGPSCYIKTGDGKRYFKPAANLGEILERWKPENEDDDIAQTDRAKIEHPKLLLFKSKGQGELTGLIRDVGSKICSFDELAFLDPKGEVDPKTKTHAHDGWEQMILPVAEWPAQFYS